MSVLVEGVAVIVRRSALDLHYPGGSARYLEEAVPEGPVSRLVCADAELTSGIVEQLYGIVAEIGAQKGYTMVLESSSGALLYNDKSIDITDAVIKAHNANPNRPRASQKKPPTAGGGGGE